MSRSHVARPVGWTRLDSAARLARMGGEIARGSWGDPLAHDESLRDILDS